MGSVSSLALIVAVAVLCLAASLVAAQRKGAASVGSNDRFGAS